jgi:hypothetical protein
MASCIVDRLKDAAKNGVSTLKDGPKNPIAAGALAGAAASLAADKVSGGRQTKRRTTSKPESK